MSEKEVSVRSEQLALISAAYDCSTDFAQVIFSQAHTTFTGSLTDFNEFIRSGVKVLVDIKDLASKSCIKVSSEAECASSTTVDDRNRNRNRASGSKLDCGTSVGSGWPLRSGSDVAINLGDLSLRARNKRLLPLRTGDFYLAVVGQSVDSSSCKLVLRVFDKQQDDFRQVSVDPATFVRWLVVVDVDGGSGSVSLRSSDFITLSARDQVPSSSACLLMDCSSGLVRRRLLFAENSHAPPDYIALTGGESESSTLGGSSACRRVTASSVDRFCATDRRSDRSMSCASDATTSSSFASSSSSSSSGHRSNSARSFNVKEAQSPHAEMLSQEFVVFTGGRTVDGSAVIELHPFRSSPIVSQVTVDGIVRAVNYLYYIHSRSYNDNCEDDLRRRTPTVILLVDCRCALERDCYDDANLEIVRLCWQAICLLMDLVPASIRRAVWIGWDSVSDFRRKLLGDQSTDLTILRQDTVSSLAELHDQMGDDSAQLSTLLDGDREPNGPLYVDFRRRLESFLRKTRALGQLYIELHRELRSLPIEQYWTVELCRLHQYKQSLNALANQLESSEDYKFVREEGEGALSHLRNNYTELNSFGDEYYGKVVEKAAGLFNEVRDIMTKAAVTVPRRTAVIDSYITARQFCAEANEMALLRLEFKTGKALRPHYRALIEWMDDVILPTVDRHDNEPSVSLVRLRMQDKHFEQFITVTKERTDVGQRLMLDSQWLNGQGGAQQDDRCGLLCEQHRSLACRTLTTLIDKLDTVERRMKEVRDKLADNLICHHFLDKVYDWALYNAKWSSQLRLLITTAACSTNAGVTELETLLASVKQQIDSYPATELEQLPMYAKRLKNELIAAQVQTLTGKCSTAHAVLEKHKCELESLLSGVEKSENLQPNNLSTTGNDLLTVSSTNARSVSPANTEYEEPIRKRQENKTNADCLSLGPSIAPSFDASETTEIRWRRCSYAGSASSSIDQFGEFYENRYKPSNNWSKQRCSFSPSFDETGSTTADDCSVFLPARPSSSASQEDLTSGIITLDMTDQVISSMSAHTLKKRMTERRAANGTSNVLLPPPNPLSLVKGLRPGSARYMNKMKKPFSRLMKRNSTSDCAFDGSFSSSNSSCSNNNKSNNNNNCGSVSLIGRPRPISSSSSASVLQCNDALHQRASMASLTSIDEVSMRSGSTESWDQRVVENGSSPRLHSSRAEDGCEGSCSLSWSPGSRGDEPIVAVKSVPWDAYRPESPPADVTPDQRMQYMILNELLQSELNYVQSLEYVITTYLPELIERDDLPHELRGQRYTIFGNIEKIYEFHVREFMPELKRRMHCQQPDSLCLEIGKLFLEHRARFHLYALYNKNKPKSDLLMTECGGVFFRTRQLLQGDKLDLSSYLLKPVQRMGKYALLLQQLLKACNCYDQEACDALKRAEEMVSFQLRHGNDLLAMDLITRCDVNLKEQGSLLRQEEFTVVENRGLHHRKCIRRVFLFEHLVLFAKPKRRRGGSHSSNPSNAAARMLADTYHYKYSIPMSYCGLTERVKESENKFEVWFRRHTTASTYVLQARTCAVRDAWVSDINKLLWRQAIKNREQRLSEMTNMGLGGDRASCVDLHSSNDRIEDRAVNTSLLHKMARFRNSFVGMHRTSVDHTANGYAHQQLSSMSAAGHGKRPHSLISLGSSSCTTSSSNASSSVGSCRPTNITPGSVESGICADLSVVDEMPEQQCNADTMPRTPAPPPPSSNTTTSSQQHNCETTATSFIQVLAAEPGVTV